MTRLNLLTVLALVLAACGGAAAADDGEGVASLTGESDTGVSASATGDVDVESAMIAFTECMRDQGIVMSDPEVDGDGNVRPGRPQFDSDGPPDDATREAMDAARAACQTHLEGVTLGFERFNDTEFQDQMLAFAACMRDQGIDLADPDFSGETQRGQGLFGRGGEFDPDDPEFQAAMDACQEELPGQIGQAGGPGGPPGGGPGSGGGN